MYSGLTIARCLAASLGTSITTTRAGFLWYLTKRLGLELLISVIHLIGSIYGRPSETPELKKHAGICNYNLQVPVRSLARAFLAQCRLLLSIALYWPTDMVESRSVLDLAIRDAFDLGMYRRDFALENGGGDPVLEESWRRTWWQIYTVDAYHTAIKRSARFLAQDLEMTVELPCEEAGYESGVSTLGAVPPSYLLANTFFSASVSQYPSQRRWKTLRIASSHQTTTFTHPLHTSSAPSDA